MGDITPTGETLFVGRARSKYSRLKYLALAGGIYTATVASVVSAEIAQLQNIRSGLHRDYTRIVLDLSQPTEYRISTLENPHRLVVDMEQTQLSTSIKQQEFADTPIEEAKSSGKGDSGLQLVFKLHREIEVETFSLHPGLHRGDRIVIDLYEQQGARTASTIKQASQPVASAGKPREPAPDSSLKASATHRSSSKKSPVQLSGTWRQEWALESDDFESQKFESVIEPRLDINLPRGMRLVTIARIRIDPVGDLGPDVHKAENYSQINGPWYNTDHGEFSLREFYLDARWGDSFWRLGKQQVVWGQADGLKVMDVVNPQSYREFILDDFDDSRIPLWMVNAEFTVGKDGSLQFLWIPDTTYHELAETSTPYAFTSARLMPTPPADLRTDILEADKPDDAFNDSDVGLRYSNFLGGWDITFNYMYHYQDFPVPYQKLRVDASGVMGVLAPEYKRNHMMGGTLSNVFGDFTLRAELVYNTDTFHLSENLTERGVGESDEFASVIGLDWQLGAHDTLISAQWFQSHLPDYNQDILRGQTEHTLSLLYQRSFSNENWQFKALGLYSPDHGDRLMQVRLSHVLRSNLDIWVGGDFFGGDRDGIFGQFSNEDRVLMGMELGF